MPPGSSALAANDQVHRAPRRPRARSARGSSRRTPPTVRSDRPAIAGAVRGSRRPRRPGRVIERRSRRLECTGGPATHRGSVQRDRSRIAEHMREGARAFPPAGWVRRRRTGEPLRRPPDGRRDRQEPGRARVLPGSPRGRDVRGARDRTASELRTRADPRTHHRTGARGDVPRPVDGRRGRDPREPRLPRRDEQRDRPVQGRTPVPPERVSRAPQVPRVPRRS